MLVSIIIPFYNSQDFLHRSLESALNQEYPKTEIICVDNQSTDDTYSILKRYKERHQDKIRLFQEPVRGSGAARNRGISESNGQWLQFLDSDDVLLPNKIKHQINLINNEKRDDIFIVGDYRYVKQSRSIEKRATGDAWVDLVNSNLGITSSNLYEKKSIDRIGGWDASITSSQEYDLMFRLMKSKVNPLYDSQINTVIYERPGSICKPVDSDRSKEVLINKLDLRREIITYLEDHGMLTREIHKIYGKYVYRHLWWNRRKHPEVFKEKIKDPYLDVPFHYKAKRILSFVKNQFLT